VLAVDHINFEVYQGKIFGFLVPNSADKTTTQLMFSTLLKPTSGHIWINSENLAKNPYRTKKIIGLVPLEVDDDQPSIETPKNRNLTSLDRLC
jgi:ABC-2 type transport system ATP-binding protein